MLPLMLVPAAAIFLLGFGLWAVPRALWKSADTRGEQRRLCHQAGFQARMSLRPAVSTLPLAPGPSYTAAWQPC
jgi:hypothetical protein